MQTLKEVLMERDGITSEEADREIEDAKIDLSEAISEGEDGVEFMEERFGLEPDYLAELLISMT